MTVSSVTLRGGRCSSARLPLWALQSPGGTACFLMRGKAHEGRGTSTAGRFKEATIERLIPRPKYVSIFVES